MDSADQDDGKTAINQYADVWFYKNKFKSDPELCSSKEHRGSPALPSHWWENPQNSAVIMGEVGPFVLGRTCSMHGCIRALKQGDPKGDGKMTVPTWPFYSNYFAVSHDVHQNV